MPALKSWLPIYVSQWSASGQVFLVSGVASILFLLKLSEVRRTVSRRSLARVVYRAARRARPWAGSPTAPAIFAFPVFGFGVIFGAIWAEEAWTC